MNSDRETILFVLSTTPVLHVALLIPTPVYIHNQSLIIIKIILTFEENENKTHRILKKVSTQSPFKGSFDAKERVSFCEL